MTISKRIIKWKKKIVFCLITLKIDSKEFIGPKAAKRKRIPNLLHLIDFLKAEFVETVQVPPLRILVRLGFKGFKERDKSHIYRACYVSSSQLHFVDCLHLTKLFAT